MRLATHGSYVLIRIGLLFLGVLIPWIVSPAFGAPLTLQFGYLAPGALVMGNSLRLWVTKR